MRLPEVGDKITAVVQTHEKVYVFSKDWHVVLPLSGFGETLEAEKEGFEPSIREEGFTSRVHPSSRTGKAIGP